MPMIDPTLCACPDCQQARNRRLQADLNAMADRKRDYDRFFGLSSDYPREAHMVANSIQAENLPGELEFEGDWHPKWLPIALSAIGCLLFFAAAWELAKAIGQQAGIL